MVKCFEILNYEGVVYFMERENLKDVRYRAESVLKSSANWFYWIAGLSMVNTLVILFDGSMNFVVGLGITQFIDQLAYLLSRDAGNTISIIALYIDLIIAGIFVTFGYFANKKYKRSFIIGMFLYALDGLIFIFFKDYLSLAFHVYALYCISKGLKAIKHLRLMEQYENDRVPVNDPKPDELYEGKTETQINYLKQMRELEEEKGRNV